MVGAIWAKPRQSDAPTFANRNRINRKDILAQVLCVRVVCLVHDHRIGVMVNGDIDRTPERHFNTRRRPAAAGEVVDDDFVVKVPLLGVDKAHFASPIWRI